MGGSLKNPIFFLPILTLFVIAFSGLIIGADDTDLDLDEGVEGSDESPSIVASRGDDEFDVVYESPIPTGDYNFAEHFDDVEMAMKRWIVSKANKEEQDNMLKYEGKWDFEFPLQRLFPADKGLVMKSKAKLHAISAKLDKPFEFKDKPLIVQYEVTFQNGMDCGGAYVKLLSHSKDMNLAGFNDKTPYTIMFGPDKCGSDMKVHFIFRHKNPVNGTFSEKHSKRPSNRVEETYTDKKPHLYQLKLTPDNKFKVFVDDRLINSGSLLEDVEPKVNPPMEIEDPSQSKPADWDEREKIADPTATKPEDWDEDAPMKIPDPNATPPIGWLEDEPEMVPEPSAIKPDDWDESMDGSWEPPMMSNPKCSGAPGCGEWTAPLITNPNFKGKWKPTMISNPNYKGQWTPPKIANPDYFEDKEPFKMTALGAVGLELWTMSDQVLFDNFIISNDEAVIADWTSKTWELKRRILDKDNEGVVKRILNYTNAHPWLWGVYVVLIALPVVLIFAFCCGSSQEKKDTHYKKTDEVLPDDVDVQTKEENSEPTVNQTEPSGSGASGASKRKTRQTAAAATKDDLEEAPAAELDSDDDEPPAAMDDEDDDAEASSEKEETPAPPPVQPQAVKRRSKSRKE